MSIGHTGNLEFVYVSMGGFPSWGLAWHRASMLDKLAGSVQKQRLRTRVGRKKTRFYFVRCMKRLGTKNNLAN